MSVEYCSLVANHYAAQWFAKSSVVPFRAGPISDLPPDFAVLAFPPHSGRKMWTYATRCMSQRDDQEPLELHMFSSEREDSIAELLTAIAHYHRMGHRLGLWHTVNFGRPWLRNSLCDHGLLSLPYLDGPSLEWLTVDGKQTRFLWVIPVTSSEVALARKEGVEELESRLERARFNYLDVARRAVG